MRFVSLVNGVLGKSRRAVSQALSIGVGSGSEDKSDVSTAQLAETLRQVMLRLNKLEAESNPPAVEFEVTVASGGAVVELRHELNGPVRWWVVKWMKTVSSAGHSLYEDPTSDQDTLRLKSFISGRAVIRIELSQNYVEPGA